MRWWYPLLTILAPRGQVANRWKVGRGGHHCIAHHSLSDFDWPWTRAHPAALPATSRAITTTVALGLLATSAPTRPSPDDSVDDTVPIVPV